MPLVETRAARPTLIRITPLIDVVFILLIFFMLTTRLSPLGAIEVSSGASGSTGSGERLPRLHLQHPRGLLWNDEDSSRETVMAQIERQRPPAVVISTDPETPLTRFTRWQGRLAERGVKGQWRKGKPASPGVQP